jgi:UDP-4-amino-4,6-dideoxy-N-acetyl-beta-L-altrosamine transaminase
MQPPIPYGRQHITDEDIAAVAEALRSDYLTQGPRVPEFEAAFGAYIHAQHCVAVSNGTAALHLAALALGVGPGVRVITSPITFAASANCIRYAGGEVWFADIDPETYTLDPEAVRRLLEQHPRGYFSGIVPVDFAGLPANLPELHALAKEWGLWVLEDACHAPGAMLETKRGEVFRCGDGQLSDAAIFSFHPVKHIACGEGGAVTTPWPDVAQRVATLRTHGIVRDPALLHEHHGPWYHEMQELGYNYRLTDFQAALGLSQLKRADLGLTERQLIAQRYTRELAHLPLQLPTLPLGYTHAWHLYVVQTDRRAALFDHLRAANIFPQVHYIPVYWHPYYRNLGYPKGLCPVAEAYYARCLSLPMYPSLSESQQGYVIDCVKAFFGA